MTRLADHIDTLLAPYLSPYGDSPPTFSVHLAGFDRAVVFDREGDAVHPAASMMKIPVALEVLRRVEQGDVGWDDEVVVRNGFPGALGGEFALDAREDSDPGLYAALGRTRPLADLLHRMISRSSNLATNLLLDVLGGPETATARATALGATGTAVRRYICDEAAASTGLANVMTATDTVRLLGALVTGEAAGQDQTAVLLRALEGQLYNSEIPAGLPPGTRVAHKTGWIISSLHDGALVWPDRAAPFVLAVFTSGFADQPTAGLLIRRVALMCWDACTSRTVEA